MSEAQGQINVSVRFYSFFKELAGRATFEEKVPEGVNLGEFVSMVAARFPKLQPLRKSMLVAVGVEYQDSSYVLHHGDEVSLFPPVQGG